MTEVARTPDTFPVLDASAAEQIELDAALAVVAEHAVSEAGAERVRARRPSASVEHIRDELTLVADVAELIDGGDPFHPEAVPDVRPVLEHLAVPGSVVEGRDLWVVGQAVGAIERVATGLARLAELGHRIGGLAVEPPPPEIARRLGRALDPDGGVRDGASPEVSRARRALRSARERLVGELESYLRGLPSGATAPEAAVTQRSGRYVVPIRRDAARRVKGIVHGESGSGATLFVEPQDLVGLGNELASAVAAEARAVVQVLRDLTDLLRPHAETIHDGWTMCVRVDDAFARARYAVAVGGMMPTVVEAPGALSIRRGRHPLLLADTRDVVPFDLSIDDGEHVLVVSGPNTGGKTVLLKSVGLIVAMVQCGIVPPVDASQIPVFTRIFADIGDHQSLEASLSTFSGHLEALKAMLETADAQTLVLVDEFGTGTDPSEGAALAGAVLQKLAAVGVLAVATTHLNQLKQLAADTAGAVNAALQFDAERLAPTYRVVKGVPGRSYGLAIARRLGFPDDVLAAAESLQPETERSFETLLAEVEAREQALERREAEVEARAARGEAEADGLAVLREQLREEAAKLDARRQELERHGREEARQFLLQARKRVEEALGLARAAVDEATAREARRLVEEGVRHEKSALDKLQDTAAKHGWRVAGRGRERSRDASSTPVEVGSKARRPKASGVDLETRTVQAEVDLRGMTGEEAEVALVRALDEAVVADVPSLRIIHGKGTGALRSRVTQVLEADQRVTQTRNPPPHQGGWGVTIAELRR